MNCIQKIEFLLVKLLFLLLILLPQFFSVYAQSNKIPIRKVKIHGNKEFSNKELIKALSLQSGDKLSYVTDDTIKDRLVNWYNQNGFLFTVVDSVTTVFPADSQFVDFDIWIQEGKCSHWGENNISGVEGNLRNIINRRFLIRKGGIFSSEILESEINGILTILEDNGYPLSEVEISSLTLVEQEKKIFINIELYVHKGNLVRINEILISGNSLTKDYVIKRESRLKIGEVYSHKKVLSIREILQRTGYFKKVEKPTVVFSKNKAVVKLKVEEGTGNTMDGIIGYIPGKGEDEKGYFSGRLQFTFKNLLGTGRFLEAFWDKKNEYSQAVRFGYEEPWLFGLPLYTGIWFHQQIRDTSYVERKWDISARYQPWNTLSIQVQAGQRAVLPDSVGGIRYNVPESHTWQIRSSIDYNTFDDLYNPQTGIHYHTAFTLGKKKNIISDYFSQMDDIKKRVNSRSVEVDVEAVFSLFRHQVVYLGLHGEEIKTGDKYVNIADQIRLGGARTLRGYEEDMFNGSRVAWINCEYRSIVGYHSRIFLFVDSGFYQRREESGKTIQGYKIGYGFGIRLATRVGMIGIDYGLGEGDSLMGGKLHVSVVSGF
ncbi:MAG: POTRA domain-containing protein [bacterium]